MTRDFSEFSKYTTKNEGFLLLVSPLYDHPSVKCILALQKCNVFFYFLLGGSGDPRARPRVRNRVLYVIGDVSGAY